MPQYTFKCEKCGEETTELTLSVREAIPEPKCCGDAMDRSYDTKSPYKAAYDTPVLSRTLAIPDEKQRAEMMRRYPNREYLPGKDGRLVMRSHQERNRILKEEGMVDLDGYN